MVERLRVAVCAGVLLFAASSFKGVRGFAHHHHHHHQRSAVTRNNNNGDDLSRRRTQTFALEASTTTIDDLMASSADASSDDADAPRLGEEMNVTSIENDFCLIPGAYLI
jgi:hypothetical protein